MIDDEDFSPGRAEGGAHPLGVPLRSSMLPDAVECPFCGGRDTEQMAAFGSALSVSQYWCRSCRTAFEFMKWRGARDGETP